VLPECADLEPREGALTGGVRKDNTTTAGEIRHSFQPVFVLDADGRKLATCHPARARQLIAKGKADVEENCPFQIRLRKRVENPVVEDADIKLDTGARHVGYALVSGSGRVYAMGEETLRADIKERMDWRRICRRNRRNRKTRYRKPRFDNRRRPEGWLPPSLRSLVDATVRLAHKLERLMPVRRVVAETASFDIHRLINPDVQGAAYQHGPLYRTDLRRYLFLKHRGLCAYCKEPLGEGWQADHVISKSRGGSDRPFNRVSSCEGCNQRKGNRTAVEFGHPEIVAYAKESYAPAAILTSIKTALVEKLSKIAPVVETDGAQTLANRKSTGLGKSHANDAICAFEVPANLVLPDRELTVAARPRGTRRLVNGVRGEHKVRLGREVKGFRQWDCVGWNGRRYYIKGRRATGSFLLSNLDGHKAKDGVGYKRLRLIRRVQGLQFEQGARLLPMPEGRGFHRAVDL
jgi:5-methylcytosine-specific restriction endonuclease McrA